ncbi:MAG: molybdenum cofactor guanylyltransferase [Deltaproteobacteria bacterium]
MGIKKADVTGVILAGGKSSRMGKNKALLEIGGERIIDKTVSLFKSLFKEVILVTNTPEEYAGLDVKVVTDIFPGKGSLGGIYTGLTYASCDYSFIVSCDMPFLKRELIEYLINIKDGFDVVVPKLRSGYEPLHAVYSRECLKPIEALIKRDDLRIIGFYPKVRVKEVSEDELAPFISEPFPFININTPEDYMAVFKK